LCQGVSMWMSELAMKTSTAERRMGSQSVLRLVMSFGVRGEWL
jgi:hypothetical protein